ncbi:LysE family translocator [Castellaniella caeni]|uniref:LysE family translocator n=1 Tax=Castellaniella caeni TaxID=266123 RepID=UPI0015E0EE89|nr:LysE family translocator [Castellaniella caeni]
MIDEQNAVGTLLTMTGFAFATSASPGPVNIVSAMSGARFGARKTIPYVFGATVGFITILAMAGVGLGAILVQLPWAEQALAVLGAIYMIYLAYRLARASIGNMADLGGQAPPNFLAGVAAQYSNPKAWVVAISAVSIYVSTSVDYRFTLILFCMVFFVVCFPSLLMWSVVGASAAQRVCDLKAFNIVMACLLIISVAFSLFEVFQSG